MATESAPASAPAADVGASLDAGDAAAEGTAADEGGDATLADMQAMMAGTDAPEGGQPAGDAPTPKPSPDPKPSETPKPAEPAAPPAEPAAAAPDATATAADLVALRKGWAALAKDKETLVQRTQEAKGAIERAKQFEQKAQQLDQIPGKFQADPLAFILELSGAKTIEEQEAFVSGLLDRVIEREKSPVEREIARLKQEIAAKEEATTKARADAEAQAAQQKNAQIIREWEERNTGYAGSTPELAEKYDLIVSLDRGEAVHQTCVAYHQKYGVILDPAQAADAVEAHLRKGAEKSKWIKQKFAVSAPAPTPTPAPATARPSNGIPAPKQTGNSPTLSSVASEGSAPSAAGLPEDDNRFEAVLREMQSQGELPDEWRVSGPGH
jgi:hypothetical protein